MVSCTTTCCGSVELETAARTPGSSPGSGTKVRDRSDTTSGEGLDAVSCASAVPDVPSEIETRPRSKNEDAKARGQGNCVDIDPPDLWHGRTEGMRTILSAHVNDRVVEST